MHFEDGTLVRDQDGPTSDGRYGDSAFDSSAFGLSWWFVNKQYHPQLKLDQFLTPNGVIRHPKSIWGANDTTEDQEKPLYMFFRETCNYKQQVQIYDQVTGRGYKTGNGNYVTPGYLAELRKITWLRCLSQLIQVLFFYLPYWDDGAKRIRFTGKTDGYLQWALIAYLTPWPFRRLISKAKLKDKILSYYTPEMGCLPQDTTLLVIKTHWALVDLL
jgi:hypothetical protein